MAAAHGLRLEGRPLLHYAHRMRAVFWPLRRLRAAPAVALAPATQASRRAAHA